MTYECIGGPLDGEMRTIHEGGRLILVHGDNTQDVYDLRPYYAGSTESVLLWHGRLTVAELKALQR